MRFAAGTPPGWRVWIGRHEGTSPADIASELEAFERRLQAVVAALDERYQSDAELDADGLAAVIDLSAWAHAEWVRIHPFGNGNRRTARILANFLFMRYGLPPVVRLRPRPEAEYGQAGARAMEGDWTPTARVFRNLIRDASLIASAVPKAVAKRPIGRRGPKPSDP